MTTTTETAIRYTVVDADQVGAIIKDNLTGAYVTDDNGLCEWSSRELAQRVADDMNEDAE